MDIDVSVIITTYNRPNLLQRAIESVLRQTYQDWECIVVDDASDEPVRGIVDSYADSRFRYYRHDENKGLSAARNTGLRLAEGAMIAYLDDDDEWLPDKLNLQKDRLQSSGEEVGLVYCWMEYVRDGEVFKRRQPTLRGNIFAESLDRQPLGNGSTWLIRRKVLEQHDGFDESLPRGIDGDMLRRLSTTHNVDVVTETLVRYHVDHGRQRITRSDRSGIQKAIFGQETKLQKFEHELESFPCRHANIFAELGRHHAQLGEWRPAASAFLQAVRRCPVSKRIYLRLVQALWAILRNLRFGGAQSWEQRSQVYISIPFFDHRSDRHAMPDGKLTKSSEETSTVRGQTSETRSSDKQRDEEPRREDRLQENQYAFPYHYIPELGECHFSQTQHWAWGYRYMGGVKVVMDTLSSVSFESLVDVGCGDGRFLRELHRQDPDKDVLGIDYSARAIRMANAMNPEIPYECCEISNNPPDRRFDVATLIEVLEHIPPDKVPEFLYSVSGMLYPGGYLILTVPHTNSSLQPKHFQHFDEALLRKYLSPHFEDLSFLHFDERSRILGLLQRLLGGAGKHFVVTNSVVNHLFFKVYRRYFLYSADESTCGRIAAVARVPSQEKNETHGK